MKVSQLATVLGLPSDTDEPTCLARIEELKRARRRKSRDEIAALVTAMEARFGIDPPKEDLERHLLATELPNGTLPAQRRGTHRRRTEGGGEGAVGRRARAR
jgi:hypothetical protein